MSKYRPYPKYKDSGVEWLGQVPEAWHVARIKNLAKLNPSRTELRGTAKNLLVSFLPMEAIGDDGTLDLARTAILEDVQTGYSYVAEDDVFIAKITPCFENGKGAVAKNLLNKIAFATTEIIPLRPHDHCDSQFLFYLLSTHAFRKTAEGEMYGAGGQKRVPDSFVANYKLAVPNLQSQKDIVSFVNSELSHIDTIISKQKQLISLLEEKRISIISHAVTKGLNPDVPMKDSGVEWLGQVPEGWTVARVKNIATFNASRTELHQKPKDLAVSFLPMEAIGERGCLDLSRQESLDNVSMGYTYITDGDIIIAKITPCFENGKGAIARNLVNGVGFATTEVIPIRPCPLTQTEYLFYLLSSHTFRKRAEGTMYGAGGQKRVPDSFVANYPVAIPPLQEQQAIVNFLDRETAKIDAIITKTRQAITLAQEHRSSIISAAVTGKICVCRPQSAEKPLSKSREYFQKVVLAAEITDQLHTEKTFGRVKLQKILFLSEYHAQLPFQRSEYQRYAAGPHDPKAMYSIEGQMKKQKWFDSMMRESGYGKEYVPLERHEAYKQYYERYFADKHPVIQRIIDLLHDKKTQFCEIIATLYGVWNDFLLEGRQPSNAEIVRDVVTNWDPKKQAISENDWHNGLNWMRDNDLVPSGWGEPTIHRQKA